MKKLFLSLAALVMTMSALVMTSCSNDLDEVAPVEEAKSNVVTITIAPPAAEPETRVTIDDSTPKSLKITGWAEGDVVTLYKATIVPRGELVSLARISGTGEEFTCTNASTGEFRGTLPEDEVIDNYNLAIYGGTAENGSYGIKIIPTTWSSKDVKDVVMMGAVKEGTSYTMKVINNVLKIENTTASDVDVAWYGYDNSPAQNRYFELASLLSVTNTDTWAWYGNPINHYGGEDPSFAEVPHFTLAKNAVNYVNLPMVNGFNSDKIGLYTSDATAVVPMKSISGLKSNGSAPAYCGHLLNAGTFGTPATTGTAQRTGGIDVNWVQLWENGPKFAEYNVGVTDGKAESYGGYYCWGSSIDKDSSGAYKSGTDPLTGTDDTATNLWGSAWRMPTQAELQALLANCDVEWTTVNGVNGRKFTGKGDFDSNSVFLPAAGPCSYGDVDDQGYLGYYWSSSPYGSNYAYYLNFQSGSQGVRSVLRYVGYSVRAVLAE